MEGEGGRERDPRGQVFLRAGCRWARLRGEEAAVGVGRLGGDEGAGAGGDLGTRRAGRAWWLHV